MTASWPKIFVVGYGDEPRTMALLMATRLRTVMFDKRQAMNIRTVPCVEVCSDSVLKKQLEKANKAGASHVVIMKDADTVAIKDMMLGEQRDIPNAYVADDFCRLMGETWL